MILHIDEVKPRKPYLFFKLKKIIENSILMEKPTIAVAQYLVRTDAKLKKTNVDVN